MKDPTRTPEPVIHRKVPKDLKPVCDVKMKNKGIEYGYNARYSQILGDSQELVLERLKPVAFDTNKTRRKMVKPTDKGSY
jgi:hypothetical protein